MNNNNKIKVNIKYKAGHSYLYDYEKTELYCPNCGKKDVFKSIGNYDYDLQSENYVCIRCNSDFYIGMNIGKDQPNDKFNETTQTVQQIKKNLSLKEDNKMEITKAMIEEFKIKADRPNANDSDVIQLLKACGGDIDKAANLMKK